MNKYQEALDNIKGKTIYEPYDLDGWTEYDCKNVFDEDDEDIEKLQELVDKATPKKPLEIIFNNFGMGERIGRCPNCEILVNQFQSHCKCDQKLDWSK